MCEKLSDPLTVPKTYWKVLNRFLSNKKVSVIPPVLANREIISNFSQKAVIFNKYFVSSSLPTFGLRTEELFSSLKISENDIFTIIKNLNSDKSHG